jgi:hypothetical protein
MRVVLLYAGVFFLADVFFHVLRLGAWLTSGDIMQFPLWISPVAIIFNGFFGWQLLKMRVQSKLT